MYSKTRYAGHDGNRVSNRDFVPGIFLKLSLSIRQFTAQLATPPSKKQLRILGWCPREKYADPPQPARTVDKPTSNAATRPTRTTRRDPQQAQTGRSDQETLL